MSDEVNEVTQADDLIERLRAIPVWMVRDMAVGWQEHGTTAYEAADEIAALREKVAELTYYLNVAVEDFDSNNGRCSNEAHWSNEARDLLAQQGTGHG